MTTAHRPTFDPAKGKKENSSVISHVRQLPSHTKLKYRQKGQGGDADNYKRDLRNELLAAEKEYYAGSKNNKSQSQIGLLGSDPKVVSETNFKTISNTHSETGLNPIPGEDNIQKTIENKSVNNTQNLRKTIEISKTLDADEFSESEDSDDSEDSEDSEDETAQLMKELAKIKKERKEKEEREAAAAAAAEQVLKEQEIIQGNPLLNTDNFQVKRKWDDDVVFKNQSKIAAMQEERKKKQGFVNDMIRSEFHKRFMDKYIK